MNYDEEESDKGLKQGTRIALILVCIAVGVTAVLRIAFAVTLRFPMTEVGRVMMAFSTALNRWSYPTIIITALALCFIMEQNLRSKRVRMGVCGFLAVQAVDLALRSSRSAVVLFLERVYEDYDMVIRFTNALSVWSFAVWLVSLVFTCLWIYGLIRDCGGKPTLWLTVILAAVCYLGGILLQSLGTGVLYAAVVCGGEMGAWIGQTAILDKK